MIILEAEEKRRTFILNTLQNCENTLFVSGTLPFVLFTFNCSKSFIFTEWRQILKFKRIYASGCFVRMENRTCTNHTKADVTA